MLHSRGFSDSLYINQRRDNVHWHASLQEESNELELREISQRESKR